jgi:hypothetical protein
MSNERLYLIGLVDLIAQLSAMMIAKSLIVSGGETDEIIAHLCSKTGIFGPLNANPTDRLLSNWLYNGAHTIQLTAFML